jgi:hypothetical protein
MTFFGNDLVRSLVLGFALGSAAMVVTFGVQPAQAATSSSSMVAQR